MPGPGDADGTGSAEIRVDSGEDQLCWDLHARQVDVVTGATSIAAPPDRRSPDHHPDHAGRRRHSQGCLPIDEAMVRELAFRGHEYYVNVLTEAHPEGAIRGQLRGGPTRQRRLLVDH